MLLLGLESAAHPPIETPEDSRDHGTADPASERSVRAGETTVWVDRLLSPRTRGGAAEWVLSGRASRTVEGGLTFIFDDVVGAFEVVSTRSFEVAYPAGD